MNLTTEYFCIEELEGFPSLTFVLLKLYKPLSYMSFMDQLIELQTQTEANFFTDSAYEYVYWLVTCSKI